jgi:hypothetical protein
MYWTVDSICDVLYQESDFRCVMHSYIHAYKRFYVFPCIGQSTACAMFYITNQISGG